MKQLIVMKLIVDERNELFDANDLRYIEFPEDYSRIREFTFLVLKGCPETFLEENLFEQPLSEIIQNGIKHGNKKNPLKKLKVWYDLRKRARFIVEDEGAGFKELEIWTPFSAGVRKPRTVRKSTHSSVWLSNRGSGNDEEDGGHSLIAALEYWNGGIIHNEKRNKVGMVRWFSNGSTTAELTRRQAVAGCSKGGPCREVVQFVLSGATSEASLTCNRAC